MVVPKPGPYFARRIVLGGVAELPTSRDAQSPSLPVSIEKVRQCVEVDERLDVFRERVLRQPFGDINPGRTHSAMGKF